MVCADFDKALDILSKPPYDQSIEHVYVIGGYSVYKVLHTFTLTLGDFKTDYMVVGGVHCLQIVLILFALLHVSTSQSLPTFNCRKQ